MASPTGGPDPDAITRYIVEAYPDTIMATVPGATFFSCDASMPHPVYGRQHWVSVLNPSPALFEDVIKPLLDEAHARIAKAQRKRSGATK